MVKSLISRFPNQWWHLILGWPPSQVSNENVVKYNLKMCKTGFGFYCFAELLQFLAGTTASTRTTRTPAFWEYPPPPLEYPYYWFISDPKSKQDSQCYIFEEFVKNSNFAKKLYAWHTFWSCLIRCVNLKWIRLVFWKLQSGHDSVHRRTDGRTQQALCCDALVGWSLDIVP